VEVAWSVREPGDKIPWHQKLSSVGLETSTKRVSLRHQRLSIGGATLRLRINRSSHVWLVFVDFVYQLCHTFNRGSFMLLFELQGQLSIVIKETCDVHVGPVAAIAYRLELSLKLVLCTLDSIDPVHGIGDPGFECRVISHIAWPGYK